MMTYSKFLMMGVAVTALMASDAWAQANPRVGIVSAVNPAATGTPPNADTRPIVIGTDVIFRERVVTTGEGQAQLMFLDQSTMMIGPNSQVVIDEFVYDPNTSSGQFAATLTQGSFRYIGGKLSKQGNATLKTPVATIGIRGSDVIVNHGTNNVSNVQNIHGNATVESNGSTVKLPTGFGTQVNGQGTSPSYPSALTAAIINAAKAAFEGQQGKAAGAPIVPQNNDVERSGLPGTVEAAQLAAIQPAAGGLGNLRPPVPLIPTPPNTRPADQPSGPLSNPNSTNLGSNPTSSPNNGGGNGGGGVIITDPSPGTATGTVQNGYAGGLSVTFMGEASFFQTAASNSPSDVTVQVVPGNGNTPAQVNGQLGFRIDDASPRDVQMALSRYAGPEGAAPTDSSFAAINDGTATVNGVPTQATGLLATRDRFFVIEEGSIDNIQNVSVCQCSFMSWGSWIALVNTAPNAQITDIVLGTFMTGRLPDISIQPIGSATFTGHAIGVSSTNANLFTAGNVRVDWNFGQRAGNFQLTNFDGNNMRGDIAAPVTDWRHYNGALQPVAGSTGPASSGTVKGSFFVAPGQAAGAQPQGTGGNFTLNGANNYKAGGSFVGQKTN